MGGQTYRRAAAVAGRAATVRVMAAKVTIATTVGLEPIACACKAGTGGQYVLRNMREWPRKR